MENLFGKLNSFGVTLRGSGNYILNDSEVFSAEAAFCEEEKLGNEREIKGKYCVLTDKVLVVLLVENFNVTVDKYFLKDISSLKKDVLIKDNLRGPGIVFEVTKVKLEINKAQVEFSRPTGQNTGAQAKDFEEFIGTLERLISI